MTTPKDLYDVDSDRIRLTFPLPEAESEWRARFFSWLLVAVQLLLSGIVTLAIAGWPVEHRLVVVAWGFASAGIAFTYGRRSR